MGKRIEAPKSLSIARPEDQAAYERAIGDVDDLNTATPVPPELAEETRIPLSSVTARETNLKYAPPLAAPVDTDVKLGSVVIAGLLEATAIGWAILTWNWWGFAAGTVMAVVCSIIVVIASALMPSGALKNNAAFRALFWPYGLLALMMTMVLSPTITERAWMTDFDSDPTQVKWAFNPFGEVRSVGFVHRVTFEMWAPTRDGNSVRLWVDGGTARLGMQGAETVLTTQPLPDEFVAQELEVFAKNLVHGFVKEYNLVELQNTSAVQATPEQAARLDALDLQWPAMLTVSRQPPARKAWRWPWQ